MKSRLALLLAALLIAPAVAAQDYWFADTPSNVNPAHTNHTLHYRMSSSLPSRVQAPRVVTHLRAEYGGDLFCNNENEYVGSFRPWDFVNRLTYKTGGKSASDLRAMVQEAQRASTRQAKMLVFFREHEGERQSLYEPGRPPTLPVDYLPITQETAQRRGEAVSIDATVGTTCFTPQQIDAILAEATRVVGLLIQSLEKGGLSAPPKRGGTTQTPVLR